MGVAERRVDLFQSNVRLKKQAALELEYMTLPGPMKTARGSDSFGEPWRSLIEDEEHLGNETT